MCNKFISTFRFLLTIIFFLFVSLRASAQTGTLKGTVKDANGLPVAGASVLVDGTQKGTTTNATGSYMLQVKPGTYTLVISYVGTATQRFSVSVTENGTVETNAGMIATGDLTTVIVGSRSNTVRTRLQTPVPVDVIQISQVINDIGQVELSQILNFIAPSFQYNINNSGNGI